MFVEFELRDLSPTSAGNDVFLLATMTYAAGAVSIRDSYFTVGAAGRRGDRRKFPFRGGARNLPTIPYISHVAGANKQVSEPVSQTSKHVVAVSCCLVGAEVTRISRSLTRQTDGEEERSTARAH